MTDAEWKSKTNAIADDFLSAYIACKVSLGDRFESYMAEIAAEIICEQYKLGDNIPFIVAAVACSCKAPQDTEEDEITLIHIKAAAAWYLIENQ